LGKKCQKIGPTHVETEFSFFSQDFFGKVKNGHLFCPFFEKAESSRPLFLAATAKKNFSVSDRKYFLKFVTIKFFYF
jgi:hypothetical protein